MLGGDSGAAALAVRVDGDAAAETAGGKERKREMGTRESERQARETAGMARRGERESERQGRERQSGCGRKGRERE